MFMHLLVDLFAHLAYHIDDYRANPWHYLSFFPGEYVEVGLYCLHLLALCLIAGFKQELKSIVLIQQIVNSVEY